MFSYNFSDKLSKVFLITLVWTVISVFQFLIGYSTLIQFGFGEEAGDPKIYFYGSLITGVLAGILGGSLIVFLWERWLRDKRYITALFFIFCSYSVIYLIVSSAGGIYFYSQEFEEFHLGHVIGNSLSDVFGLQSVQNFFFWLFVVIFTLIALLVNDKYGPGVFKDFLLGKYFQPTREERIFMFMDLRSSTTIAEKLGEVKYFNFIKEVFKDVTPAILSHRGEIYQYVGDEIVVSWKMENGLQNSNCISTFFSAQQTLNKRKPYYEKKYNGIHPEFKAGFHYGHVMAGEVGVVKREIAYSGDVLNTTARIQSKCNEHGVDILLSKYLLDKLNIDIRTYSPKIVGDIMLRGKLSSVMLCTL